MKTRTPCCAATKSAAHLKNSDAKEAGFRMAEIVLLIDGGIEDFCCTGSQHAPYLIAVADFHLIVFRFLAERHIKPGPAITANPCTPYPADADRIVRHSFRARMNRRERPEPDAFKAAVRALIGRIVER